MRLLLDTHYFLLWWLVYYSSLGKEARAGVLPRHYDNPFDRMLVAHSGSAGDEEGPTPLTRDWRMSRYAVETLAV